MDLSYDVRTNLLALVDLLNSSPDVSGEDSLASPQDLVDFAARHGFSGDMHATPLDVAAIGTLRERFEVALDDEIPPVADAINQTFEEIRTFPQLVRHEPWDWHIHFTRGNAPLSERIAADIVLVLIDLIRAGDLSRLRRCAASDCTAALADLTRNRSKRYCDVRNCANRTNVAAYRARRDAGA
ncbi:CGNR zinc finger domain-containing protein [Microbacterium sp. NIBRBAC000506063]|uniref:CGNR zinc finger domain-containing protein n=1 Tax=Microbacterium sp. NIBRBAC000506063 TaxID=2734618 RepID=UPI001BB57098|nr:CGNR zinc finger domain-containing protein [Microbacterium sp. NIBRBAC000506063]QTV79863.1 CGNR zinc finger domain-containing protein [Microbacterium sp. NIBRBAC000506063]